MAKELDKAEVARLARKVVGDVRRQRINGKRYPWAVVAAWASAWLEKEDGPGKIDVDTGVSGSTIEEGAKEIAGKLSGPQREAMRGLFNEGRADGAGVATIGALEKKGLIEDAGEVGEYEITQLGKAVCAILAVEAE